MSVCNSIFQQHLALLQQRNPQLAMRLFSSNDVKKVKEVESLPTTKIEADVVIVFGLSHFFAQADNALEEGLVVIAFEHDLALLKGLLHEPFCQKLLKSQRFFIFHIDQLHYELELKLAWTYLFCSKKYYFQFQDSHLKQQLETTFQRAELIASEYKDFGVKTTTNILTNLKALKQSAAGDDVKLSGTAVICGAGPSLDKHLACLKDIQDKVFLFAGGSALECCKTLKMSVDIACVIDPDHELRDINAPRLFYSLRSNPKTVDRFGASLFVFAGSGESCLEQKLWELNFPGYMCIQESGWNVGNFMAKCALEAGCDTLIFVGMDMVYHQDQEYTALVQPRNQRKERITICDKDGQNKVTRPDYLAARAFFEELIKQYPHVSFYTMDAGGLVIEGAKQLTAQGLQELTKHSKKSFVVTKQNQPCEQAEDFIVDQLKTSFLNVKRLSALMLEQVKKAQYQGKDISAYTALYEHELEQELFVELIFVRVWDVWKWKLCGQNPQCSQEAALQKLLLLDRLIQEYTPLFKTLS